MFCRGIGFCLLIRFFQASGRWVPGTIFTDVLVACPVLDAGRGDRENSFTDTSGA